MTKTRGANRTDKDDMAADYVSGMSQTQIVRKYGTCFKVVNRLLTERGIEIRVGRGAGPGPQHHNWKGGRQDKDGYILVRVIDGPFASMGDKAGYVREHRLRMAEALERPLTRNETVHHINGNTRDNRLENLQLRTGNHGSLQAIGCTDCGSHRIGPVRIASRPDWIDWTEVGAWRSPQV